jgi:YD repeat-containing protein
VRLSALYDTFSRGLVAETIAGASSVEPVTTLNSFDDAGRQVATRSSTGAWTTTTFDPVGRPVGTVDALGNTTQSDYDLAGQRTATRDAMGVPLPLIHGTY